MSSLPIPSLHIQGTPPIFRWVFQEKDANFAPVPACSCECADWRGGRCQAGIGFSLIWMQFFLVLS